MRQSEPSFFLTKNTGAPIGDLDGWMWLFARFSQRKSSSSFCSAGDRGNVREQGSSVPGVRSMAWSHAFHGGSSSKASCQGASETGNVLHPSTCRAPTYLQNGHSRG